MTTDNLLMATLSATHKLCIKAHKLCIKAYILMSDAVNSVVLPMSGLQTKTYIYIMHLNSSRTFK